MRGWVWALAIMVPGLMPGLAAADCAEVTVLSCPVEGSGKILEVCATGKGFTYSFGPEGAPELQLRAPFSEGPVLPWPGVGRAIWSAVRFRASDHVYEVWLSFDRMTEEASLEGGVSVRTLPEDEFLASLNCSEPPVAMDLFGPEDLMAGAGYCWNSEAMVWERQDC